MEREARRLREAENVLNGIRDALEERGYAHMANGRDIGALLDELESLRISKR